MQQETAALSVYHVNTMIMISWKNMSFDSARPTFRSREIRCNDCLTWALSDSFHLER